MNTVYFDTETTGLDPFTCKMTVIQLKQGEKIRIIQSLTSDKIRKVKDILESSLVVGHNLKFDLKFIKHYFDIEPTNLFDTYIAEILISGGQKARRKGTATLEAVANQYTGIQLNKSREVRMSFNGSELTEEQIKYAAMDVAVLPEIHKKQQEQLKELGLEKVFEIEMGCIPATVWLELSGLPLDMEGLNRVKGETKQKIEDSKLKVKTFLKESGFKNLDLFGLPAVNLDSHIQLLAAMRVIGLKINSTGDEVLSGIVHPIGKAIKEYRKQQKLLTGFILKYPGHLNKVTGRIQPSFNQCGTNTGRFTSSKPNMQQVPHDKSIRALFKAGKGKKIITADYSQIELRIIAEVSKFLDIYKNNRDLHRLTASLVLNKPKSEITKDERQQAKAINFGFAYGLGAQSFKEKTKNDYDIDISIEQAQEFRDTFFKNYPILASYLQTAAGTAAQLQQIRNRSGRIVRFDPGLEDWQYENMGRNTPIQSLSADITKTAMGRLYHKLKPFNAKLINAVHDELVFEVQDDRVTEAAQIIKDEMEAAGSEYLKSIPCIVEVVMGESWQK